MFKTIALLVVLALAALLVFAATRPDTFRVERRIEINAPAPKIHALINDLKAFSSWNPYEKKDPAIKVSYRGPASGPGAAYDFAGNKEVGKGSITITGAEAPTRVAMKLDMIEPFEGHNDIEFSLAPNGTATTVVWAMHGPSPYIAKLAGIFFNMDRMIGEDFEAGLLNLKAVAERG